MCVLRCGSGDATVLLRLPASLFAAGNTRELWREKNPLICINKKARYFVFDNVKMMFVLVFVLRPLRRLRVFVHLELEC